MRVLFVLTLTGCMLGVIVAGVIRYETASALPTDGPRTWSAVADLIEAFVLLVVLGGVWTVFAVTVLNDRPEGPPKGETVVRVASPKGHEVSAKVVIHPPPKPKANDSSECELTLDP